MIQYDARIIRQFAKNLYVQANFIVALYVFGGLIFGALVGSLFSDLMYMLDVEPAAALFLGAIVFCLVGLLLGLSKSFQLKLQAQAALCQAQIEENTRATLAAYENTARDSHVESPNTGRVTSRQATTAVRSEQRGNAVEASRPTIESPQLAPVKSDGMDNDEEILFSWDEVKITNKRLITQAGVWPLERLQKVTVDTAEGMHCLYIFNNAGFRVGCIASENQEHIKEVAAAVNQTLDTKSWVAK